MSGDRPHSRSADDSVDGSSIPRDPRQRRIISMLLNRSHPMTVRDLSVELVTQETGMTPSDATEEDYRPVQIDLYHQCLPKLEAEGWIERHPEGVVAAEQLPFGGEDLLSPDLSDPCHPLWEAVEALLVRPRRQELVSIIARQPDGLTLEDIVTELDKHGYASWPPERHENEPSPGSTLHHMDLPKLAEVGLIEYDSDEKTVTATRKLLTLVNRTDLSNRTTNGTESN